MENEKSVIVVGRRVPFHLIILSSFNVFEGVGNFFRKKFLTFFFSAF